MQHNYYPVTSGSLVSKAILALIGSGDKLSGRKRSNTTNPQTDRPRDTGQFAHRMEKELWNTILWEILTSAALSMGALKAIMKLGQVPTYRQYPPSGTQKKSFPIQNAQFHLHSI
ncbi:Uncharacterized protein HZ326_30769 [Fusarium oxysporum f. sp. albedinis]|nr:Uncharacterized protein HZ326_30769 [Fusarium oxysporum f. sp. albedinis]